MDLRTPDTARDFGRVAGDAFAKAGGLALAREAEADPSARESVRTTLDELGGDSLDPRAGLDDAFAAAALCREAGAVVLPYPVVGSLLATDGRLLALASRDAATPLVDHGDLATWRVAAPDGTTTELESAVRHPQPLGPFLCRGVRGAEVPETPATDVAWWLTLDSFVILGTVDELIRRSAEHLRARRQFGRPLASFQGLRFRMADVVASARGLAELAHYTLTRCSTGESPLVDAIALRVAALETAQSVLGETFQFHGAVGFCTEHDVSVLARHLQTHLRVPWQFELTTQYLVDAVAADGFETLFGQVTLPRSDAAAVGR